MSLVILILMVQDKLGTTQMVGLTELIIRKRMAVFGTSHNGILVVQMR